MMLKCTVVILFLCFFATSRGDIEQRLSALEQNMKTLDMTVMNVSRDLKKLLNDASTISKLSPAEVSHYQRYTSGQDGIEIYVKLEGIRDGLIKKNLIPILGDINAKQRDPSWETSDLYEKLNKIVLDMLKNREEEEIEALLREDLIETSLYRMHGISSMEIKNVGKKVLLKFLREDGDCKKTKSAISHYREDQDFMNDLFEVCESGMLTKYPILDALTIVNDFESDNFKLKAYKKLMASAKGEDLLKVIDAIFNINELQNKKLATELRKNISYNDEALKKLMENSTELFHSKKLRTIQLRYYLDKKPNDVKIAELALNLQYSKNEEQFDYDYLEDTVKKLPKSLNALAKDRSFCLTNNGRYVYVNKNFDYILVSEKNVEKPYGARWSLEEIGLNFMIINEETTIHRAMISFDYDERKLAITGFATWKLNFIDLLPRLKIGNEEQFFKIQGDHIILDNDATIWNMIPC